MSNKDFLTQDNINMLWDVICDEYIVKNHSKDSINKVSQVFSSNINGFYEVEKNKTRNIMDLNKKYIMLMLDYINKNFAVKTNYQETYKINENNQSINVVQANNILKKENYTHQEVQNERMDKFDKDLKLRQQEFENMINIQVPPAPDFKDNFKEAPINEMDKILKEMTAQRNYDIEVINRNNIVHPEGDNWLKSQETSLRNDKFQKNQEINESTINQTTYNNKNAPKFDINDKLNQFINNNQNKTNQSNQSNFNNQNIKYIKIDKEDLDQSVIQNDIIELNTAPRKHISWGENTTFNNNNDNENDYELEKNDIFTKLKKVNNDFSNILPNNETNDTNKTNNIKNLQEQINTMYTRFESMDTKIEQINKNIMELIKKMNEN